MNRKRKETNDMKQTGLYVHIPFCMQKCLYCDFPSFAGQLNKREQYVEALQKELIQKAEQCKDYAIKTIFFGGGTPTVLSAEQLQCLMDTIKQNYCIIEDAEISIEANPGTLDFHMCQALYNMGFNRISMGLQAWQNHLLQILGRIHTNAQFLDNFQNARKAGFKNINVDLMFALPNQTISDWLETLEQVTTLQPEHISAYSLIIEEGTPFYDLYEKGVYQEIDEQTDREMYHKTVAFLKEKGYHQYEISNFSKNGKQSRHNSLYWLDGVYMGVGLGAHSYWAQKRFHNPYDLDCYIQKANANMDLAEDVERIPIYEQYSEFMFLGLRMTDGVSKKRFLERFGKEMVDIYGEELEKLKKEGLLEEWNGFVKLTERGIDVSNYVFVAFLKDVEEIIKNI